MYQEYPGYRSSTDGDSDFWLRKLINVWSRAQLTLSWAAGAGAENTRVEVALTIKLSNHSFSGLFWDDARSVNGKMFQKLTCKSNKLLFYCTLNIWISDYSSSQTLPGSSLTALHLKCMMWLIWAQRESWLLAHQLRWWPLGYLVLIIITINSPPSALWSSHSWHRAKF